MFLQGYEFSLPRGLERAGLQIPRAAQWALTWSCAGTRGTRAWGRAVCVAAISLVSGILEGAVLTVWAADGVGWGCFLIHRVTEGGKDL